jgi:hypothetical protein
VAGIIRRFHRVYTLLIGYYSSLSLITPTQRHPNGMKVSRKQRDPSSIVHQFDPWELA